MIVPDSFTTDLCEMGQSLLSIPKGWCEWLVYNLTTEKALFQDQLKGVGKMTESANPDNSKKKINSQKQPTPQKTIQTQQETVEDHKDQKHHSHPKKPGRLKTLISNLSKKLYGKKNKQKQLEKKKSKRNYKPDKAPVIVDINTIKLPQTCFTCRPFRAKILINL
ncbi:hypothetical protein MHK_009404 [Candidatus Magnetomorum sp. HK-1]|nr:hypothetical protein MHK_009404 [Candidatus Magnetomorum sp. HK-1]